MERKMGSKKILLMVFLLNLILSIFISGYAETEKKEEMLANTPYVDPKGFFKIVPPAGWKIQEYPEDPRGKVAFMAPEREVEFRIMASVKDFSSFEDLYQTTLENTKDIKNRFGINVDIQKTTFLGRQAIKRNWAWKAQKFFAIEFMDAYIQP